MQTFQLAELAALKLNMFQIRMLNLWAVHVLELEMPFLKMRCATQPIKLCFHFQNLISQSLHL